MARTLKVAVLLAGCGHLDGAEAREAVENALDLGVRLGLAGDMHEFFVVGGIELVGRDGDDRPLGHLAMRVHERGSGETRSCGTGAVASVLAARFWGGAAAPDEWTVDVPGGRLRVRVPAGSAWTGESAELLGPARIVAEGTLTGQ